MTIPPSAQLMQLLMGAFVSRAVSAAAELGVADALRDGPRTVEQLQEDVRVHPDALNRLLRALTSVGVFQQPEPGSFALTELSELLCSDTNPSLRGLARLLGARSHWDAWGRFDEAIRTGQAAAELAFGEDIFSWLAGQPHEQAIFNQAMSDLSRTSAREIVQGYDFSACRRVVDVGGGQGVLLSAVLQAAPEASGLLFDLPHVVASAVIPPDLKGRLETVGGDFFETAPEGGDTYLLKHIIHDWDDARSLKILGNIRQAMRPDGRVLLLEAVLSPEPTEPHPGFFMDLNMLAMTPGGRERTANQFASLLARADLKLNRIVPLEGRNHIVEAVAGVR